MRSRGHRKGQLSNAFVSTIRFSLRCHHLSNHAISVRCRYPSSNVIVCFMTINYKTLNSAMATSQKTVSSLTLFKNLSPKSLLPKSGISVSFRLRFIPQRFVSPVRVMGSSASSSKPDSVPETGKVDYASLSDDGWKKRLTNEQFYVTRKKGTERAFTGEYWNSKTPGTYHCICCDTPLFQSSTKFDSGTGWPSYYQPIGNNVKSKLDLSVIFMPRQEVVCVDCNAHLGHVFDDGPPPTGKRYCINSVSLKLKPEPK